MLEVILLIILLALAALTAASETAIIAVSRLKLRRLSLGGSKAAKIILKILEAPEKFFGTILVANNIVDVLIASIVTAMMIALLGEEGKGVFFATVIVTFLIIVSEVAAKTLAAKHSEKLSLFLARPVQILIHIFSPLVKILAVIVNAIVNFIGGEVTAKPSLVTEDDIRVLIKAGEEETLHKEKYKMLSRVFDFSEAVTKNVMTPKSDVVSIDVNASLDAILSKVLESGYSRLPVYKDSPDNIIGIINMKDLLNLSINRNLLVLQDIVYPATFIPNHKKVTELLKEFQKGHTHLAIVVDQEGKMEGLVTLEDLLEEIVGEIKDEYDIRA
ncbi:MAG: HlyC/CorC family transporter [Candidatus Omnitrophica bacterium]|nr:HlyC/CorC family transporter [Candidatus Omnitrophota bacterium]